MDSWSELQLAKMHIGGNKQCLEFLLRHGIEKGPTIAIKERYDCPASYLYQQVLTARREGRPEPTELPTLPEDSSPSTRRAKMKLEGFGSAPMLPEQEPAGIFKRFSRTISFQEAEQAAAAAAAENSTSSDDGNMFSKWGLNIATQVIQDEEAKERKEDSNREEEEEDLFNIDDLVNQIVEQNDEGFSNRWSQVQKESAMEQKQPENLFSRWSRSWSSAVYAQGMIKVKEEEENDDDNNDDEHDEGKVEEEENEVDSAAGVIDMEEDSDNELADLSLNDEAPPERTGFFRRVSRTLSSSTQGSARARNEDGDERSVPGEVEPQGQPFLRRVRRTWSSSTQGSRINGDESKEVEENEGDASVPKEIQTAVEASKENLNVEDQEAGTVENISNPDPSAEQDAALEGKTYVVEPEAEQ